MDASSADNIYLVEGYSAATPSPTPTATPVGTPTPTPVPTVTPTPGPPTTTTLYYGTYAWNPFSGTALIGGGSYSVKAGSGCFVLLLQQPAGVTARHYATPRRPAPAAPSDNATGVGFPRLPTPAPAASILDEGPLTSLTITNLTRTSGSGSFGFTTSAQSVTGTITITGSQTFTGTTRARFAAEHRQAILRGANAAKARRQHRR
ncbi:MAG TPA: hypothetical protein VFB22_18400 [Candidatus Baltobacteraceae bacterium]|nr:hypothetical protein [Candidatus Baltobacteraceae bacterium]